MLKVKYHLDDSIERYKGRLVAQQFSKIYKINYTETLIPKIRQLFLRIFLAINVILKMPIL